MRHARSLAFTAVAAICVASLHRTVVAASQASPAVTPDQHIAALKQNLSENQKRLQQYEWIETTIISVKGEEKSRKQQRCYYGADGKVQKVPVGDQPQQQAQQGRGGRGGRMKQQIVENKKEDMQDYMERAASLVQMYIPPNPEQVQKAKDAGRMAVRPGTAGRVTLEFTDYLLKGDRLSVEVDGAASRLLGMSAATYLDKPEDKVTLSVRMGSLTDGTGFTEQ